MFNSILSNGLTITNFTICIATSLILGFVIAIVYKMTNHCSKSFLLTLIILPTLIQSIIIMSNGNIGTSVAILGAFSLIRFRSLPGTSKEITAIFFCMTVGVGIGLGLIIHSILLTLIVIGLMLIFNKIKVGNENNKILKIVIPEDVEYQKEFKEIFDKYLKYYEFKKIQTINLGSLFEITYNIKLIDIINLKEFIDELRIKNNNLKIVLKDELELGEL